MAEKVINQFPVKKMMLRQLNKLGDLNYTGDFYVRWHKEIFQGELRTAAGKLDFNFSIDGNQKYVSGQVSSPALAIGKVMDLEKLGNIDASARFCIDISKPRTAAMRRKKGGHLPIGTVNATINDCPYMGIHIKQVSTDIVSDGAIATGEVLKTGKIGDLHFFFSFTNTDEMKKMKITHPGLHIHWPWEKQDDATREAKRLQKEQKKEEKLKKKEEKRKLEAEEEQRTGKKKKKFILF